jgi:amino acid transporter
MRKIHGTGSNGRGSKAAQDAIIHQRQKDLATKPPVDAPVEAAPRAETAEHAIEAANIPAADAAPATRTAPPAEGERVGDAERLSRYYRYRHIRAGHQPNEPRLETSEPPPQTLVARIKYAFIGSPIPTTAAIHERIGIFKALALLSSDALSSVAYGTEASLAILLTAGIAFSWMNLWIGVIIIALLAIVAFSYRQTIMHYPKGGGSYIVASHHLGEIPGLIAAAALLLDYILTVSVSVSAGVDAVTSALPSLFTWRVVIGVSFIVAIVIINLRGVRESGSIFAIPTYLFVGSYLVTIIVGIVHAASSGGLFAAIPPHPVHPADAGGGYIPIGQTERLGFFLILTAFASGCSAMTGTEAIADGVPVFRGATPRHQSLNAAKTLIIMATLLAVMYGGTTFLTWRFGVVAYQNSNPTILSQIAQIFFGRSWFYFLFQLATTLILTLAANTSFSDFPRLSSILAHDDYMPHAFQLRGGRLAFNTGILVLGVLASSLLIFFNGNTDALINLYALGVFTAFTLSQSGMVGRWLSEKEPGWQAGVIISSVGALATGIVTVIIVISKTPRGAWVILLLVPLIVMMFKSIKLHYEHVAEAVAKMPIEKPNAMRHVMIVPIASLNHLALNGLAYARSLTPYVMAVNVDLDPEVTQQVREQWDTVKAQYLSGGPEPDIVDISAIYEDPDAEKKQQFYITPGPELVVIQSPYRLLAGPIVRYIDKFHNTHPHDQITVVLPEFVPRYFWENVLHNQTALWLKLALINRPYVATTNVPYRYAAQKASSASAPMR